MRPSLAERFWPKVLRTTTCWFWEGALHSEGYGQIRAGKEGGQRLLYAHRVAYEDAYGPIPAGYVCDHICRVRRCVNPSHIRVVTHRENILAGIGPSALEARREACLRGHLFDAFWGGKRRCRTCSSERKRRRRAAGMNRHNA